MRRVLRIGRWVVDFIFAEDGYDEEAVLGCLYDMDAPYGKMRRALEIMESGDYNRAFTFANADLKRALVMIGPTTSGEEFINSLSHEIDHLSDAIAEYYGIKGHREGTSYLTGDTTMALAKVICRLGCHHCR